MPTNTPYNQPDPGSTDWHIPLNENAQDIGEDIDNHEDSINTLIADMNALESDLTSKADTGHTHSGDTLQPNALGGNISPRSGGVTHIQGNIYVSETDPANDGETLDTGDIWIQVS